METRKEEKRRKPVYIGPCPLVTFAYHTNISQGYSLIRKISILGGYTRMRSGSLFFLVFFVMSLSLSSSSSSSSLPLETWRPFASVSKMKKKISSGAA